MNTKGRVTESFTGNFEYMLWKRYLISCVTSAGLLLKKKCVYFFVSITNSPPETGLVKMNVILKFLN